MCQLTGITSPQKKNKSLLELQVDEGKNYTPVKTKKKTILSWKKKVLDIHQQE